MVKLNDASVYAGSFICMDGNLNVVLENATLFESIDQAQTATSSVGHEVFSDVFIRGNNVCYITPSEEKKHKKNDGAKRSQSASSSNSKSSDSDSSSQANANREMMIQTINEAGM